MRWRNERRALRQAERDRIVEERFNAVMTPWRMWIASKLQVVVAVGVRLLLRGLAWWLRRSVRRTT